MAMSKDTQDKLIDTVKLLGLVGFGVLVYWLGSETVATFIIGGALGHAVPTTRRAVAQ